MRAVAWTGVDQGWAAGWRAEMAVVEWQQRRLRATGTQLGVDPIPYLLDYELRTGEEFVTDRLHVRVVGAGWTRSLELTHDGNGSWAIATRGDGVEPGLPGAGGDPAGVEGALDCDLGFSPLTNFMPVRRHGLHQQPGAADLDMAWVSVPDLEVHRSRQRYEHLDPGRVRFIDRTDADEDFVVDLELDADGLVLAYPGLARRVS